MYVVVTREKCTNDENVEASRYAFPYKRNVKPSTKEWGFYCTYYTYITVFIRNAANLTLLLLKGSKLRKGNKIEILVYTVPLGPLKIFDF
jgi:hypothetical protein